MKNIFRIILFTVVIQILLFPCQNALALHHAHPDKHPYDVELIQIPKHLAKDFQFTFLNQWSLVALVGGSFLIGGLYSFDDNVKNTFDNENRLGKAKDVFNLMGNPYVLGGSVLFTYGISKFIKSEKLKVTAETLAEAFALSQALTLSLKYSVKRTRPDGSDNTSFPSGHVSGAFAIATVLESLHGPKYGIPAYAISTLIALSRMDANKHYLSDVLAGALIGTLSGYGTSMFHKKEYKDVFILPTVSQNHSFGLSVYKSF